MSEEISAIDQVAEAKSIRLIIPDTSPLATFWAPHQMAPSGVLARLEHIPPNNLPVSEVTDTSLASVDILLTSRLGYENQRDLYYASVISDGKEHSGLVVKIVDISFFAPGCPDGSYSVRQYGEQVVCDEFYAFNRLESLQGSAVPRFAGLFSRGTVFCLVFEDAGRHVTGEESIDPIIRAKVLAAAKACFAKGVAACVMSWHNVCIDDDRHVKIVDMGDSGTIDTLTAERLRPPGNPRTSSTTNEEWLANTTRYNLGLVKSFTRCE